jgi:hypothetical protein
MNRVLIICLSLVLVAAAGLQLSAAFRKSAVASPKVPLAETLPGALGDWTVKDKSIAETEEMKRAVGELLNFDDAVFRSYRRGTLEFDVYVAYWRPGKMSHRLVAGHTPDVCWVQSGWTLQQAVNDRVLKSGPGMLAPAQYRVFKDTRGTPREVVFWHVSGTRLIAYDGTGTPPWWAVFSDLARYGLNQRESQYFIRISSPQPLEQIWREPALHDVLKTLRAAGI